MDIWLGLGTTHEEAWNNAWDTANINTLQGCQKRHAKALPVHVKNGKVESENDKRRWN
jgi:hypothetical protein